jgi:hypothetical protein
MRIRFSPDAYRPDIAEGDATDGVEVSLCEIGNDGYRRELGAVMIDPRARAEDRGARDLSFDFALPHAGEIELFIGPGPSGRDSRDWVSLGRITIR